MAAKKRTARKKRRWGWKVALALLVLLALCLGGLYATARVVHVRYATVYLRGLPPAFEGTTLLFVSDIDAHSAQDARAAAAMMDTLAALRPDVLLLGGDYAAPGFWEGLNGMGVDDPAVAADAAANRYLFLSSLADFPAPLGKFAVAAADDVLPGQLLQAMGVGSVRLLDGATATLTRDGQTLTLAGLSPTGDVSTVAGSVRAGDCVIAFTHSPALFPAALTAEASDGGLWVDVLLAGSTHGGQVRLGSQTLLPLTGQEQRYAAGWRKEGGAYLLTSQGVGCEGLPLRLGTTAEVHFITLRRAQAAPEGTAGQ